MVVRSESAVSLCILGQRTQISRGPPPRGELGVRAAGALPQIWFRTSGVPVSALLHRPRSALCPVSVRLEIPPSA